MVTVQDYLKNPKWVKHIDESFQQGDKNGDGVLSREDWHVFVDNLAKAVTDRPSEVAKLRAASSEFTTASGLTAGVKANQKKYQELAANIVVAEIAKLKRGEETLVEKMENALFNVLDRNRDGNITFDRHKTYIKAGNFPEDAAEAAFACLDKSGEINRKEYISFFIKFWFYLDDPEVQGMFGSKCD